MAKYIKQEMNNLQDEEKPKAYYRMQVERNIDTDELVHLMSVHRAGVSDGIIKAVLMQLAEEVAYQLAEGRSVTIDGLGTLQATIGVRRDKEMDGLDDGKPQHNALSLEVNGVNFKADKELVKQVDRRCTLERGGVRRLHRSPYSREERLALAQRYLDEHATMRIADYVALTGLSRTAATQELIAFRRDASTGITISGRLSHSVYVKREIKA
ncbi:MAG: DNA-binding protein [Bacteroidaceae bacterium]|nr:DNA-binding protein [Bacteroidaceae bacterium]